MRANNREIDILLGDQEDMPDKVMKESRMTKCR